MKELKFMKINKKRLYILRAIFGTILIGMLYLTITATVNQNIYEAVGSMWTNWWFKVTLADAYFGFLTFFVWVAYKERQLWRKVFWFALIMLLGNLAISAYMLLELYKLRVGDSVETMLTRRNG